MHANGSPFFVLTGTEVSIGVAAENARLSYRKERKRQCPFATLSGTALQIRCVVGSIDDGS
jgi:hypothetical protein